MPVSPPYRLSLRPCLALAASLALALGLPACDDDEPRRQADTDAATDADVPPDTPDVDEDAEPDLPPEVGEDADADAALDTDEEPGTIEQLGIPDMAHLEAAHEAAAPTDDEIVIYYYRPDGNYEPWGVWLWAYPVGDGANHWEHTQDFTVVGAGAYLKFRRDGADVGGVSPVGPNNEIGLIVRQDAQWVKDGDADRVWNLDVSNEIVVFSGDQNTYPYGAYRPFFESATMVTTTRLDVVLSGRHALQPFPDDNGFVVRRADGSETYGIADVQNPASLDDRRRNYTKELRITLSDELPVGPALVIDHPAYREPLRINNTDLLIARAESTIPAGDYRLGALYDPAQGSVEFRLWTPFSTSVAARLYEESGALSPDYVIALTLDEATGVWSGTFDEVDPEGMFYDYFVTNARGTNAVLDPYAVSMDAYVDDSSAGRGAIVDLDAAAATPEGWEADTYYALAQREDAIIYEIHVRDFTIAADSGVEEERRGTYAGFIDQLPYLQALGVTHIQLLPVLNFYFTDETDRAYEDSGTASGNNYNWGYDPHNYFTPEGWYASDPRDPYVRVRELRELIMAIHDADMAVLLDVVYNHIGSVPLLENVVPGYFFRTNPDGTLTSSSGVGNDLATTRAMVRRLIVDSTRFWCEEYHVDGFRFDLMGIIDTVTMETAYAGCADLNPDTLFQGEGWKLYNGPPGTVGMTQDYMTSTDNISVFNDEVRNLMKAGGLNDRARGFLTGLTTVNREHLFLNLIGQPQRVYTADDPGDSMAYLEAHDNLTLHDNIAFNLGLDDEVLEEREEIIARMRIGNFLILTSQSIPFLHGGQERARSKPRLNATTEVIGDFVSNSYDSADNINEFPWTVDEPAEGLIEFTRGLIWMRRATPAFRIGDQALITAATDFIDPGNSLAFGYSVTWEGATYFILANASEAAVTFDLGTDVSDAEIWVDSDEANHVGVTEVSGVSISEAEVTLDPLSQALLVLPAPLE
jgi:pullulanase